MSYCLCKLVLCVLLSSGKYSYLCWVLFPTTNVHTFLCTDPEKHPNLLIVMQSISMTQWTVNTSSTTNAPSRTNLNCQVTGESSLNSLWP